MPLHPRQPDSDSGKYRDLVQRWQRNTHSDSQRHSECRTAELCIRTPIAPLNLPRLKLLIHIHSDGNLSLLRLWLYIYERYCLCEPCSSTTSTPNAYVVSGGARWNRRLECRRAEQQHSEPSRLA